MKMNSTTLDDRKSVNFFILMTIKCRINVFPILYCFTIIFDFISNKNLYKFNRFFKSIIFSRFRTFNVQYIIML